MSEEQLPHIETTDLEGSLINPDEILMGFFNLEAQSTNLYEVDGLEYSNPNYGNSMNFENISETPDSILGQHIVASTIVTAATGRENRAIIQEPNNQSDFNNFYHDLQSAVSTNTPELPIRLEESSLNSGLLTPNSLNSLTQVTTGHSKTKGKSRVKNYQNLSPAKKLRENQRLREYRKTQKEKMKKLEEDNRCLRQRMEGCVCGLEFERKSTQT